MNPNKVESLVYLQRLLVHYNKQLIEAINQNKPHAEVKLIFDLIGNITAQISGMKDNTNVD